MQYIYLAIFIIFTSLHLYASYKNNQHFRDVTKTVILLSVLGFYLESVDSPSILIALALVFSWIGDVLLIPKGLKWFISGGIAFMASHMLFVFGYKELFSFNDVPVFVLIICAASFIAAVTIIFIKLTKYLKKALIAPMFLYLLINGCMNCFAIFRHYALKDIGSMITVIGALLFFISDTSLFFVRFNKESKMKSHFLVMSTYSLGEFLIVLGLILK